MGTKTLLSSRLLKVAAANVGKTLEEVNDAAGLGTNYIYRLGNSDSVKLATINKIAVVLGVKGSQLLEDVEDAEGNEG